MRIPEIFMLYTIADFGQMMYGWFVKNNVFGHLIPVTKPYTERNSCMYNVFLYFLIILLQIILLSIWSPQIILCPQPLNCFLFFFGFKLTKSSKIAEALNFMCHKPLSKVLLSHSLIKLWEIFNNYLTLCKDFHTKLFLLPRVF